MLLDRDELKKRANAGDAEKGIASFDIRDEPDATSIKPYDFIWGEYTTEEQFQALFWRPSGSNTPIRELVRLKLSLLLLEAPHFKGGAGLSLRTEKKKGTILNYFPLHNHDKVQSLSAQWLTYASFPWEQPYEEIKNYFGEKIALYFKFLGHYTAWLIIPAILGLLCQLVVIGTGDFSHPILPFYALLIAIWAVLMLEFWKREEKFTALQWGMLGFEDTQIDRPEFFGEELPSYIDGALTTYYPPKKRQTLMAQSFALIGSLAAIVLGAVISIYVIRSALYETVVGDYSQIVASVMNSIQITIFNIIYSQLADHLTEKENHRTDTSFEDSMIAKLFMFQFVNSYASFFYLAFIATYLANPADDDENTGQCGYSDCMIALAINLGIIFGTRLTLSNVLELGIPLINAHLKDKKENEGATKPPSNAEKQYRMEVYDQLKGSLNDYAELSIQFGYMAFFITALPAAAFGAFVNNYVEIRTDAYKLLRNHQRPIPGGVEDIGTWQTIFSLMATICVITNAGIVVFTMRVLTMYSITLRMWLFIGFQWLIFAIQYIVEVAIPDEPYEVQIQVQRAEFITDKLLKKVRDDNADSNLSKALDTHDGSLKIQEDEPESMKQ
eukprot:CAMPEP_0174818240 /NCGR_PEP_ID=MMETSP1107-20130205/886_1 /TAXON_ID=36770 /ORGANISM="Paraphysomonas vestita, Strain GFlagA" /LENGTH=612 /DNA_ID=CAMNT_0016029841 /DNA_START=325 /DNA_END=2163 /DNA_ORIENTATION=+